MIKEVSVSNNDVAGAHVTPSQKLRIAFLLERFPCVSETFILNQIIYLIQQGHQLDIYAYEGETLLVHPQVYQYNLLDRTTYKSKFNHKFDRFKKALNILKKSSNRDVLLKTLNVFKYGKDALSLRLFFKTAMFASAPAYDIIHVHFGNIGRDAVMIKESGVLKHAALITTFHGFDINPKSIDDYKDEYKELFRVSDLITANSNFTLNLLKKASCPEDKLVKLPVSLDTSFIKRSSFNINTTDITNIIFCGRLIAFKAPELVVEIADRLVNKRGRKNLRFHIIGSGPREQLVKEKLQVYNLNDYFVLHGAMVQDDIIKKMSSMDIFLYPGINDPESGRVENQGLVLQEAQSMELPVITSDVGGIPEGVIDGRTAFVVKEGDFERFADKIELLTDQPDLRASMGRAGRTYVVQNFDFNILGKKLEEYYVEVLTKHKAKA